LRVAIAAYLARYKSATRLHTEPDLRIYLTWCAERDLEPPTARRHQVELYVRWLQEVRRSRPPTVSRRLSVVAGFYRTCVIDGVLEHSPADHVRRPDVPPESPTLGHPQTVRYRMRQIERIIGDDLADPDARFALEAGLRALRLRERATTADASREHEPEHEIH
jgi:site-specific recombinase XerD